MNENQIVEYQKNQMQANDPEVIMKWIPIAEQFAKSGLFPEIKTAAQAFAIIRYGAEIGLSEILALQSINIIKGRLAIGSQALLSLAETRGVTWNIVEETKEKCVIDFSKGKSKYRCTVTMEECEGFYMMWDTEKKAMKMKDNWKKQPANMLYARCVSKGLRRIDPGCAMGMYTPEETTDFMEHKGFENAKQVNTTPASSIEPKEMFRNWLIQNTITDEETGVVSSIQEYFEEKIKDKYKHQNHFLNSHCVFVEEKIDGDFIEALKSSNDVFQEYSNSYVRWVDGRREKAKAAEEATKARAEETLPPVERNDPIDAALAQPVTGLAEFAEFLQSGVIDGQPSYDYFSALMDEMGQKYSTIDKYIQNHCDFVTSNETLDGDFELALKFMKEQWQVYAMAYKKYIADLTKSKKKS
jgi:hypothetical protein